MNHHETKRIGNEKLLRILQILKKLWQFKIYKHTHNPSRNDSGQGHWNGGNRWREEDETPCATCGASETTIQTTISTILLTLKVQHHTRPTEGPVSNNWLPTVVDNLDQSRLNLDNIDRSYEQLHLTLTVPQKNRKDSYPDRRSIRTSTGLRRRFSKTSKNTKKILTKSK